jgi:hypothetical protein
MSRRASCSVLSSFYLECLMQIEHLYDLMNAIFDMTSEEATASDKSVIPNDPMTRRRPANGGFISSRK